MYSKTSINCPCCNLPFTYTQSGNKLEVWCANSRCTSEIGDNGIVGDGEANDLAQKLEEQMKEIQDWI